MVPMCFNFYSGVCAEGKMGPLRLRGGWHILPNGPAVMTLASAVHCVISKNITGVIWKLLVLTRPLRTLNPLISEAGALNKGRIKNIPNLI